jgi:hypothetical protein
MGSFRNVKNDIEAIIIPALVTIEIWGPFALTWRHLSSLIP